MVAGAYHFTLQIFCEVKISWGLLFIIKMINCVAISRTVTGPLIVISLCPEVSNVCKTFTRMNKACQYNNEMLFVLCCLSTKCTVGVGCVGGPGGPAESWNIPENIFQYNDREGSSKSSGESTDRVVVGITNSCTPGLLSDNNLYYCALFSNQRADSHS